MSRIIKTSHPSKVILFGSALKGNMTEKSDFDILVVTKSGTHRRRTAQLIYKNLSDIGFASYIIVVIEEDLELFKNEETSIISSALKEGKVLYAA
ncbi:MAG TPA: nucleotidyltransferase domain-containing protein [Ignavibacteriales bacterium]|nr:nucleotidyltransferase domain-containing protein [Ignavibacteriales bacterium]